MKRSILPLIAIFLILLLLFQVFKTEDAIDPTATPSPTTAPTETVPPADTLTPTGSPTAWDIPSVTPLTMTPTPTETAAATNQEAD